MFVPGVTQNTQDPRVVTVRSWRIIGMKSLASDVKQLKTEAKRAEATPSTPYMEPEIPSMSQPMVGSPVSLDGIRLCPEIAARVDNVMAQDATATS